MADEVIDVDEAPASPDGSDDTPEPETDVADSGGVASPKEGDPREELPEDGPESETSVGGDDDDPIADLPATIDQVEVMPTIPGQGEWMQLCQMAAVLATSELVPRPLRNKPQDVLLVLLTGRELQIGLTTALRSCHVIEGQVTVAPKLRSALVEQKGLGKLIPKVDKEGLRAIAYAVNPAGVLLGETEFTWSDGKLGGMVGLDCDSPFGHSDACTRWNNKAPKDRGYKPDEACKTNWRRWPWRMLTWRAMGYGGDDYFPSAGLGLYAPDELGAVTDEDGDVIDVHSVELPRGFGPEPIEAATADQIAEVERFVETLSGLKDAGERGAHVRDNVLRRWKEIAATPRGAAVAPEDLSEEQAARIIRLSAAVRGEVNRALELAAEAGETSERSEESPEVGDTPDACPMCGSTEVEYSGDIDESGACSHYECGACNGGFDWPPGCSVREAGRDEEQAGVNEPEVRHAEQPDPDAERPFTDDDSDELPLGDGDEKVGDHGDDYT